MASNNAVTVGLCLILGVGAGVGGLLYFQSSMTNATQSGSADKTRDAQWECAKQYVLARLKYGASSTFPPPPPRKEKLPNTVSLYDSTLKARHAIAKLALAKGDKDAYLSAKSEDLSTSEIMDKGEEAWVNSWVDASNAFGAKKHTRFLVHLVKSTLGWTADAVDILWDDEK